MFEQARTQKNIFLV